jgi:hypothetical protein
MSNMSLKLPAREPKEAAAWALEFSSQLLGQEELINRAEKILGSSLNQRAKKLIGRMVEEPEENPDRSSERQWQQPFHHNNITLVHNDCFDWLQEQEDNSIHAVVTDPRMGWKNTSKKNSKS